MLRVLIIDDDATNLAVMGAIVRRLEQAEAVCFSDPAGALDWLAANIPDMVLLDQMMPGHDGLDVLRALRADAALSEIPILMVTANTVADVRMEALERGATDFLTKPIRPAEFRCRVRNLLALRRSQKLLRDRAAHLAFEVEMATRALRDGEIDFVTRLCRAAEFRDPETGAHVERMAMYSRLIARHLGWKAQAADNLYRAAPMHDVGKLGIPDQILLKPGRLTEGEQVIMRRHAEIGYAILSGSQSPLIRLGAEIALTHHERWDGAGYPHRLAGEAIPLSGRIVAVADVFDALTSTRPYKAPWPLDRARAFLEENRGRHFDPACVDAFLAGWGEALDILRTHGDPVEPEPEAAAPELVG